MTFLTDPWGYPPRAPAPPLVVHPAESSPCPVFVSWTVENAGLWLLALSHCLERASRQGAGQSQAHLARFPSPGTTGLPFTQCLKTVAPSRGSAFQMFNEEINLSLPFLMSLEGALWNSFLQRCFRQCCAHEERPFERKLY